MQILILGAGAIGGYYGGRLVQAGADVTFMVRSQRAETLSKSGLVIKSALGDFCGKVKTLQQNDKCPTYDIVFLACKSYDLHSALISIQPAVENKTAIIPILNGVEQLNIISESFPFAECWGGIAKISTTLLPDGSIHQFDNVNQFVLGTLDGHLDTRAEQLISLFRAQAVDATLSHRIKNDLWDKFTFIATMAGITCLMRGAIDQILLAPSGKELITQLLNECASVSEKEGFPLEDHVFSQYLDHLVGPSFGLKSSMLRDIEKSHRTEVEHILGDMLKKAKKHSLSTPLLEIATTHVRTFELQLNN